MTILETQNGDKIRVEDRIGHGTPPEGALPGVHSVKK